MSNNAEYYAVFSESHANVPDLMIDNDYLGNLCFLSQKRKTLPSEEYARLEFNPPYPPHLRWIDGLKLSGTTQVFSQKIYDVLSKVEIKGLQLVPTIIKTNKGELVKNFWTANIYQRFAFFDEEKSKYGRISKITGEWKNIEKVVLDKEKLASVPLEDRLVFIAEESCIYYFYHKSVVDIIMSANPEGVYFTPVGKLCEDEQFD